MRHVTLILVWFQDLSIFSSVTLRRVRVRVGLELRLGLVRVRVKLTEVRKWTTPGFIYVC